MNNASLTRKRLSRIGLDIGSHQVKAVQLSRGADGAWTLRASAAFPRVRPDAPLDSSEARRIGDVLFRRGFVGSDLVLAIADDKLLTANLELPPRSADIPLDQIARAEFARSLKLESAPIEFAYWDLPAPARAARATHVMGVGCRHEDCEPLIDALELAGFEPRAIEVEACALTRACFPVSAAPNEITAIVDVGWRSVKLFVVHQSVVSYKRSLGGYGIQRIAAALGEKFGVTDPEVIQQVLSHATMNDSAPTAERSDAPATDRRAESRPNPELSRLLRSHFDAVATEIKTSVSYTSHQYPDAAVKRVLLCGGGAGLAGLDAHLAAALGAEAISVRAGDVVKINDAAIANDRSLTLAIGLAQLEADS